MSKYTLTIEGEFKRGECRKCPIGVASDVLKGKGIIYSCMYALGGGSKEYCPLEEVDVTDINAGNKVKRGEWFDKGSLSCRCSNCGCKNTKESRFCPNCGADMREIK